MNEKLPATAKDTGKFFLPAPSERSVLSTVIFFLSQQTLAVKPYLFVGRQQRLRNTARAGASF